jgi:hypothetical protein
VNPWERWEDERAARRYVEQLWAEDARERLDRAEARYPGEGPLRRATPEEVEALLREADARWFPSEPAGRWRSWPSPAWHVQRLSGAAGD